MGVANMGSNHMGKIYGFPRGILSFYGWTPQNGEKLSLLVSLSHRTRVPQKRTTPVWEFLRAKPLTCGWRFGTPEENRKRFGGPLLLETQGESTWRNSFMCAKGLTRSTASGMSSNFCPTDRINQPFQPPLNQDTLEDVEIGTPADYIVCLCHAF